MSSTFATEPYDLDEEFDATAKINPPAHPAGLVITGLSDEEDAARYIAKQFNPKVKFCRRCEVEVEIAATQHGDAVCPYCDRWLWPVGTPPFDNRGVIGRKNR